MRRQRAHDQCTAWIEEGFDSQYVPEALLLGPEALQLPSHALERMRGDEYAVRSGDKCILLDHAAPNATPTTIQIPQLFQTLRAVLSAAQLDKYFVVAYKWCVAEGAVDIADLSESIDDLAAGIGVKSLEKNRLRKAITEMPHPAAGPLAPGGAAPAAVLAGYPALADAVAHRRTGDSAPTPMLQNAILKASKLCPGCHALENHRTSSDRFECSKCQALGNQVNAIWGCHLCNYHLCRKCLEEAYLEKLLLGMDFIEADITRIRSYSFEDFLRIHFEVNAYWGEADVAKLLEVRAHLKELQKSF